VSLQPRKERPGFVVSPRAGLVQAMCSPSRRCAGEVQRLAGGGENARIANADSIESVIGSNDRRS